MDGWKKMNKLGGTTQKLKNYSNLKNEKRELNTDYEDVLHNCIICKCGKDYTVEQA